MEVTWDHWAHAYQCKGDIITIITLPMPPALFILEQDIDKIRSVVITLSIVVFIVCVSFWIFNIQWEKYDETMLL